VASFVGVEKTKISGELEAIKIRNNKIETWKSHYLLQK
jgi:hypothetical protein